MKKKEQSPETLYNRDPDTGAYIIQVSINDYSDIFNDLDPAPFRRRDLDGDMKSFLDDSSSDIPWTKKIMIKFEMSKNKRNNDIEKRVREGLKAYFSSSMHTIVRKKRRSLQRGLTYIFVSIMFLLIATGLALSGIENILYLTLVEGLYIGGWVFLWEAISTFSFKAFETQEKFKRFKRFKEALVIFTYT